MPWEVQLSDGRTVEVESDEEPTEDDLFSALSSWQEPEAEQPQAQPVSLMPPSGFGEFVPRGSEELAASNFQRTQELSRAFPGFSGAQEYAPISEGITSALSVSPQTVQNAGEVVRAAGIARNLQAMGIPVSVDKVMADVAGQREIAPGKRAQVAAGLQNVGAGIAGSFTDPLNAAAMASGVAIPALAPAISGAFALHMGSTIGEQARAAGEASVTGTPFEKTTAFGNLATTAAFVPGLAAHAVRPLIPKRLLSKPVTTTDTQLQPGVPREGISAEVAKPIEEVPSTKLSQIDTSLTVEPATAATKSVTLKSVLDMSPEQYFDTASKWSAEAMSEKGGINPQVRAEFAAQANPDLKAWQEAQNKASADFEEIKKEVSANPEMMGDPLFQKRFTGAAQRASFFSEGRAILDGSKQPNAKTVELSAAPNKAVPSNPDAIQNLVPAVKYKGETHIGQPGETHAKLISRVFANDPEAKVELQNMTSESEAARGFAVNGTTEFIDRNTSAEMVGMKPEKGKRPVLYSEWLNELRAKQKTSASASQGAPSPTAEQPASLLVEGTPAAGAAVESAATESVPKPPPEAIVESPVAVPEMTGMGAATPAELQPSVAFKTSNKNATVDAERKARGLPPMMDLQRQSNQTAWSDAMRRIDDNPQVQDELIVELGTQPRAVTATENAMLMHRRIDLRNEYEKALHRWKEAFESDDMVRASEESQRVKDWSSRLGDLEDITKATGAESGRSLQARKMVADEDFTLATMELKAMEAKGRSLTPEEHIELIKANERIAVLEGRLAELDAGREAKEVETETTKTIKEVSTEAPKESKSKDFDVDRESNVLSGIKAKVDKGQQNEITPLVQQLARLFWRQGIRERVPMIDALHEALKTIIPDFTRDMTQRAFSGYGDFKPLSKAEIDVGLRDLRGQTQQVLKIEALEARKPLEKTGQERRTPSDAERRLIKQVNELKRKYGVVVTDPATQLKSALQSRKTYYEHRIADLKHEISTRERIVKTKSDSPRDAELDAMIAERDRLQAEHDAIFPKQEMTPEQQLKQAIAAAERNQAQWEVRLENAEKGIFGRRTPGRKVSSAELELIQAETAAVREHVKELHDLDAAVLEKKRTESLDRQKATLEKDIAEQERKLRESDLESPGQRMNRPADPALEELKQKRDTLNKQLAEARKKPEAQKYAEAQQRELERLNKAIAEREAKVAAGDLSSPARKTNRPLPPELEQARQKLEAVNKQLADMRKAAKPVKSKEEIALQSLKTRMATQTAEFKRRVAAGDFAKRERNPVALDAEGNRLKAELDIAKEQFNTKLEQDRWARASVFQKSKRTAADIYDAARALMTTGEFSFILRQGKWSTLSHPIRTAKALPDTFRALLGNETRVRELELKVLDDPLAAAARQDKLFLDEHGTRLSRSDEILMGRLVGNIPVVSNFNNAARVFLNKISFDMWKAMRKSLSKSGTPTPEEGRQIAMFVNESRGRGGLGKLEAAAVPLARIMFSPRYYFSRLQLAVGHALWGGTMRTRRVIATEYARSLVGLGLYYTALGMFFSGDDKDKGSIGSDPRSTEFGKVKIGKTRLDPLAGLSQVIVLGSRTATGEKTTQAGNVQSIRGTDIKFGGDKWSDIVKDHLQGKLHPVPSSVVNLFDGTDLGGDEATLVNQSANMIAPITYVDIYAALKEQGLDDGVALALLALLGEGLQTYKDKK